MEDLHYAGGVPAVLSRLSNALKQAMTVTGEDIGRIAEGAPVKDPKVIRSADNPYHPQGGIAVLRGNLAPDGRRRWWVDAKDFGTGPFRWIVSRGPRGPQLARSEVFKLPNQANETMIIVASGVP